MSFKGKTQTEDAKRRISETKKRNRVIEKAKLALLEQLLAKAEAQAAASYKKGSASTK